MVTRTQALTTAAAALFLLATACGDDPTVPEITGEFGLLLVVTTRMDGNEKVEAICSGKFILSTQAGGEFSGDYWFRDACDDTSGTVSGTVQPNGHVAIEGLFEDLTEQISDGLCQAVSPVSMNGSFSDEELTISSEFGAISCRDGGSSDLIEAKYEIAGDRVIVS